MECERSKPLEIRVVSEPQQHAFERVRSEIGQNHRSFVSVVMIVLTWVMIIVATCVMIIVGLELIDPGLKESIRYGRCVCIHTKTQGGLNF